MATASSLNAISSIINGQGLAQAPALVATIAAYQTKPALASYANAYVNSSIAGNVTSNIITQLNTIGATITSGHFLLDLYPGNISPTCSAPITPWSANLSLPVGSFFSANSKIYTVTGNIFSASFDSQVLGNSTIAGFSTLLNKQASLPFSSGMSGFANVFQQAYGYSQQVLDTVSSVKMLTGKKYKDTGVGYTGPVELVTGGIGQNGNLLANVISTWGTMYDIDNITKIHDPYVFGQHLLNQGFGYINGLSDQLTAVGLDITDLPNIPAVKTTVTQQDKTVTVSTFVGEVELPTIEEVTVTTPVTGNSPTVVVNIYKTVTGSNLQVIVNAANITSSTYSSGQITSLADYLDFKKIVNPELVPALTALNINTFEEFSRYLGTKVGQGKFKSWAELAAFLRSFETPALTTLPTGASTNILYDSTITNMTAQYGTGSGALGNPIMIDYLGACAGDPYAAQFANINANYDSLSSAVAVATQNLDQAVIDYCTAYLAYEADFNSNVPVGLTEPSISTITNNVAAVNSALSSIPNTYIVNNCNSLWYNMMNRLSTEVTNLNRASIYTFPAGTPMQLLGFAESIGQLASSKTEAESYQFFANIITNDLAGDTVRAVIAETINNKILNQAGISTFNDPDPRAKIYQSQTQNIPLSTYISRNK